LFGLFSGNAVSLCLQGLLGLLLVLCADVNDLDAFLAVVLGAAIRELGLGVELVLEEAAAGSLLDVDQRSAVAHLFSKSDLFVFCETKQKTFKFMFTPCCDKKIPTLIFQLPLLGNIAVQLNDHSYDNEPKFQI
jgi:hypothetical protein